MKPVFEQIYFNNSQSLNIYELNVDCFNSPLHFHPEVEIVLILESFGKRFVGESVEFFNAGDLLIIGPNVPHVWLNDKLFLDENNKLKARALVVQFNLNIFDNFLINCNEFSKVSSILQESKHGIVIEDSLKDIVTKELINIPKQKGVKRITKLIELLEFIKDMNHYKLLNKEKIISKELTHESKNFTSLNQYLLNNYSKNIDIEIAANLMGMTVTSFSRFFKKITRVNFTKYINQLRIDYACKLLIDDFYSISQICYEVGFNNLSYFNRTFKLIIGKTPKEYRMEFRILKENTV